MVKSRGFAIFMIVVATVFILFALLNVIINTERVSSWLPLLVFMPVSLGVGIQSLRAQKNTPPSGASDRGA